MNFLNSIKFKFTLWYLAILSILLVLLSGGIYITLSQVLHRSLDDSLKMRAVHLSEYRDIISIIESGTFEGDVGELISFYFYSNDRLRHISPAPVTIQLDRDLIKEAIAGKESFSTILSENGQVLRIYARPFTPDKPRIRPDKFVTDSASRRETN